MRIKTGLLAIAGALSLAAPLAAPMAAMAQPYGYNGDHRAYDGAQSYGYAPDHRVYEDRRFVRVEERRIEREREFRRAEWLRHLRWEHDHRGYGWDRR